MDRTQAFIHLKCLRKWQENVQARDVKDERAFRCSVCRSLFSVPPPKPRASTRLFQTLRGLGGAVCITLLALGLSGPPVPHLALLVLLLLGSRSSSLLALALLLMGTLLATLHARGLRVVMRMDGAGRLGLAVIRHGGPVEGLGPGTLLVASEGLDHTMFRRSVVLLYEHGREGAKGVLLTQGLAVPPAGLAPMPEAALGAAAMAATAAPARVLRHAAARSGGGNGTTAGPSTAGSAGEGPEPTPAGHGGRSSAGGAPFIIRHFLGGPVGMPGEGVRQEMVLLHTITGVQGATSLPLQAAPAPPAPANHAGGSRAGGRSRLASLRAQQGAAGSNSSDRSDRGEHEEHDVAGTARPAVRLALAPNRASPAAAMASSGRSSDSEAVAAESGQRESSSTSEGGETGAAAGLGSATLLATASLQPQLFMGGALTEVLERAGARSDPSQELAGSGGSAGRLVHVYHGVCSWAEGQLEGEIRSGAWSIGPGRLQDVLPQEGAQPQPPQLWAALLASGRLVAPGG
ncbi:hypothetical protein N2152v2_000471 [Parachlorella kessleri]